MDKKIPQKKQLHRNVNMNGQLFHQCEITVDGWYGLVGKLGFYSILTLVGYLTPNPFLCK